MLHGFYSVKRARRSVKLAVALALIVNLSCKPGRLERKERTEPERSQRPERKERKRRSKDAQSGLSDLGRA
jgi:hypothetical protein